MTLPNFLIAGAMKAGTTWLAHNLNQHPQVFIAPRELHFFNNPKKLEKGIAWYEQQFDAAGAAKAIGEKTAGYFIHDPYPTLIDQSLPDVKILVVLRNPITRAASHINHLLRDHLITPNALIGRNLMGTPEFSHYDQEFLILGRGFYAKHLEAFYETFGRDRVMVIVNESDIRNRATETLQQCCQFLDVDPSFPFLSSGKRIHEGRSSLLGLKITQRFPMIKRVVRKLDSWLMPSKGNLFEFTQDDLQKLHQLYDAENERLFEILDRPMPPSWKG